MVGYIDRKSHKTSQSVKRPWYHGTEELVNLPTKLQKLALVSQNLHFFKKSGFIFLGMKSFP